MTEQATTESVQAPPAYVASNPLAQMAYDEIVSLVAAYNAKAETLAKSKTTNAVVVETLANSDDPAVVKFRADIEKVKNLLKDLDKKARDYVKTEILGSTEIDEATEKATREELKSLKGEIDEFVKIGTRKGGDDFVNALPELSSVSGHKGTGAHAGRGSGVKRMRVASVRVEGQDFKTFTLAKAEISARLSKPVETKALHSAYFEAANVENFADAPDSVTFDFEGITVTVLKDDVSE